MTGDRNGWAPIIRRRRKALDLTQAQLARVAGVSEKTVNNAENEANTPQRGTLAKLLEALGLPRDMELARKHVLPEPTYTPHSEVDWQNDDVRSLIAHLLDRVSDLEVKMDNMQAARDFAAPLSDPSATTGLTREDVGLVAKTSDEDAGASEYE